MIFKTGDGLQLPHLAGSSDDVHCRHGRDRQSNPAGVLVTPFSQSEGSEPEQ